ncbi:hypothetical protein RRG08_041378 [Elysia crispata]|uniref:Alkaline phosphatase n=1 Tax=Elysia crispata TaxID=231223 RepID=A0AAE1CL95_9GAST|nr:hypothetical protein RRG08_041378 [Elysia crispata]
MVVLGAQRVLSAVDERFVAPSTFDPIESGAIQEGALCFERIRDCVKTEKGKVTLRCNIIMASYVPGLSQRKVRNHFLETTIFLAVIFSSSITSGSTFDEEGTSKAWLKKGRAELQRALHLTSHHKYGVAKNIILFLGDGMGISTVTAARIRGGQILGRSGEDNLLTFERFPHIALTKTYSADNQVTDSAAAGTSMLTGVKVNSGVLGCDSRVTKGNCSNYRSDTKLKTILHDFIDEGMSTGIVTNSRLTHATPASAYAQSPSRGWEGDVDMPSNSWFSSGDGEAMDMEEEPCEHVDDIAKQLVMNNKKIKVLMGGGRRYFLDNATKDPESERVEKHHRRDGLNLVEEWKRDKLSRNASARYVWNRDQLDAVDPEQTDYLLGLFDSSHMPYEPDDKNRKQPSLVEMTQKALEILQKDKNGYFLLVEGARIDFAHHDNSAITAISETLELDQAVATAERMTNGNRDPKDTLIIVTADHSHGFAIQGYAPTGHDILGKLPPGQDTLDNLPYTTLGYTNGPYFQRQDLTNVNTADPNFHQQGCIPLSTETHAGEDVSVYAKGPWAHLFHATHDQSYIYHVMQYASCVGRNKKLYCD